jgi:ParB/RepB/Spo0J family partition protein
MTALQPIPEAQHIPVALLEPSPTNPRKHFDPARLAALAGTVRAHGVMQPLLVRAIAGRDASQGRALYEIVAGERRWRAAGIAEQFSVPCMVRELTDFEVLELQLVENLQRDDLHPLEEAEGYEQMLIDPPWWSAQHRPRAHGYTVDELATHVGRSASHIRARLRLLALTPAARNAFFNWLFGIGSALSIAHLNTMHQAEIVQRMQHDAERGAAWSQDTVLHMVQNTYMLRLAAAAWDLHDAALLPAAGACSTCRKRSGSDPELFDDITESDRCADAQCFAAKATAHHQRKLDDARARGATVISDAEAVKLWPHPTATIKGYLRLDLPSDMALSKKPLREVLGDQARDLVLIDRPGFVDADDRTTLEVMPTPVVRKLLKSLGKLKEEAKPTPAAKAETKGPKTETNGAAGEPQAPAGETSALDEHLASVWPMFGTYVKGMPSTSQQKSATDRAEKSVRAALRLNLLTGVLRSDSAYGLPEGIARVLLGMFGDFLEVDMARIANAVGATSPPKLGYGGEWAEWSLGLDDEKACQILLLALVGDNEADDKITAEVARLVEIGDELPAIEHEAKSIVAERLKSELLARSPKAKQAATKKAAPAKPKRGAAGRAKAKATITVKYRDASTGDTWSGRGLQPKWLTTALAKGRKLSDFDVATPGAPPAAKSTLSPAAAWPFPTGAKPA